MSDDGGGIEKLISVLVLSVADGLPRVFPDEVITLMTYAVAAQVQVPQGALTCL